MAENKPVRYAVVGHPVSHSLSPFIHQAFAVETNQSLFFEKIDVDPLVDGALQQALIQFFERGGRGCNVTLPFKTQAFELAEQVSSSAEKAQAASCLYLRDDGVLFADNYDGVGLTQDLIRHHDFRFYEKNILIVGAGGAVRGILHSLLEKAPKKIIVANRSLYKAKNLIGSIKTQVELEACALDAIPEGVFDLIIHATSLGHVGQAPVLPSWVVGHQTLCYDLSYGRVAQPFLSWAKAAGARKCIDGTGMLVELNALTFYLWRGIYPETHTVLMDLFEREVSPV